MKKLWTIGLIIVLAGSFINGILIRNEVTGILCELMRLVILVGIGVLIYGGIKAVKKK